MGAPSAVVSFDVALNCRRADDNEASVVSGLYIAADYAPICRAGPRVVVTFEVAAHLDSGPGEAAVHRAVLNLDVASHGLPDRSEIPMRSGQP